jgi:hypothetical protein
LGAFAPSLAWNSLSIFAINPTASWRGGAGRFSHRGRTRAGSNSSSCSDQSWGRGVRIGVSFRFRKITPAVYHARIFRSTQYRTNFGQSLPTDLRRILQTHRQTTHTIQHPSRNLDDGPFGISINATTRIQQTQFSHFAMNHHLSPKQWMPTILDHPLLGNMGFASTSCTTKAAAT